MWVKNSGVSTERASVMLLGDSDGNKFMPYIVFKTKPSNDQSIRDHTDRHKCGFGHRIWKDVREIRRTTGLEEPVLLLWDDLSGHWTGLVKSYTVFINGFLLKVPPHTTVALYMRNAVDLKPSTVC
ncbi:hypothetical protein PHYSODRAFT_337533 [Phytophthora sojae]|uniref:DDE-1 domain-containing protein n=1 Tax=Phytophthora sojae (strain P6497) TaxID=1094619 RepID=G5A1F9_PHYSP|nr:hypothetical protein PHYSODRAFT_337533 [Phytophthora sojae]EGZ10758.1 hypothetical protein PHYSODRAFT_337533 [Phytophthora sojae]|eukprot:XP_009533503.1 hypothetical protein PHYSODRAFT_337533 [Phytophthora sojae]